MISIEQTDYLFSAEKVITGLSEGIKYNLEKFNHKNMI